MAAEGPVKEKEEKSLPGASLAHERVYTQPSLDRHRPQPQASNSLPQATLYRP